MLIDVCTDCNEYFEKQRYTHHGLSSPQEHFDAFDTSIDYEEAIKSTKQHSLEAYKYFRRQHCDYLMAVGQHNYIVTEPRGGGYWAIDFTFMNRAVSLDMPDEIECSHEI
ncbi:MAG: hypothetical protein ACXW1N_08865 [Halobacteriota archaeon]